MHIVMFCNSYYPQVGGVEKHIKYVAAELQALGHEVRVVTLRHNLSWPEIEVVEGVSVYRRPHFSIPKLRYLQMLYWIIRHWRLLAWADVFHGHDSYLPQLRYLFRAKRFVHTFHGYEGYPLDQKTIMRRRWIANHSSACVNIGDFISKWYGTPADIVLYGGVHAPVPLPKPGGQGLLFVGRLAEDTGVRLYFEMLNLLQQSSSAKVTLVVCGDGPLRAELEDFAKEHQLSVLFKGMVTQVEPYIAAAQIVLVSGYLAILEAEVAARNVVCLYDNPLKHDYLSLMPHSEVFLNIVANPQQASETVTELLSHPSKAREQALLAQRWAAQQTWRHVAEKYLSLY